MFKLKCQEPLFLDVKKPKLCKETQKKTPQNPQLNKQLFTPASNTNNLSDVILVFHSNDC